MFEVIKHMCLCKYEIQMTNFGFKLKCPILNTFVYFTNTSVHLQTKKVQPSNTELKNTPRVQSLGPLMRRPAMGLWYCTQICQTRPFLSLSSTVTWPLCALLAWHLLTNGRMRSDERDHKLTTKSKAEIEQGKENLRPPSTEIAQFKKTINSRSCYSHRWHSAVLFPVGRVVFRQRRRVGSRSMSCQRHFQRPPTSANLLGSSVNVISKLATTRSPRPPSQGSQAWAEKPEEALRHRKRRRAPPRAPG